VCLLKDSGIGSGGVAGDEDEVEVHSALGGGTQRRVWQLSSQAGWVGW